MLRDGEEYVCMTAYKRQKEKVSRYLAFDSSKPSGPCAKSKMITKEHKFFSKYLVLTLDLMAFKRQKRDNYPSSVLIYTELEIYEEHEIFDNQLEVSHNVLPLTARPASKEKITKFSQTLSTRSTNDLCRK